MKDQITMTIFKTVLASAAIAVALTGLPAAASTLLGTFIHDYGFKPGGTNPGGNDTLFEDFVRVSDASTNRFSDSISFASLNFATIDRLEVFISAARANDTVRVLGLPVPTELWSIRFQGSAPGAFIDDLFIPLTSDPMSQNVTLSPATDFLTVDAFQNSVDNKALSFWFSEFTRGNDEFDLYLVKLQVYGTLAAIPLPAAGWLMLAGLGGLGLMKRRRRHLA